MKKVTGEQLARTVTFSVHTRCNACGDFPPKRPTDLLTDWHPAANVRSAGSGCTTATLGNCYYEP